MYQAESMPTDLSRTDAAKREVEVKR